jgi:DNA helicase-2/ATP-dependent DNA helicase PcrA
MMSALIKAKSDVLETAHVQLKDTVVLSEISKAKAREETPDGMQMRAATDPSSSTNTLSFIAEVSSPDIAKELTTSCTPNMKLHYEKPIH